MVRGRYGCRKGRRGNNKQGQQIKRCDRSTRMKVQRSGRSIPSPPAHTFASATFLVISSTPESPLSLPSFFAAFAKLSVDRTVGPRFRCSGLLGWLLVVGLGFADPGSTDPLLGAPRSEPVRELVRDIECCWLISFPFSFSIRSETSASFEETSTGLEKSGVNSFEMHFQRTTNLAAPNGFGRAVFAGLGEERGETTVDVLVDLGVSSSFRRAGVGGVDWFGLVLPLDAGRFLRQSPSSEVGGGRLTNPPPPNLLPPPDDGSVSSDGLNLDPIVQVSPSAPVEVESPPPNPLLL